MAIMAPVIKLHIRSDIRFFEIHLKITLMKT